MCSTLWPFRLLKGCCIYFVKKHGNLKSCCRLEVHANSFQSKVVISRNCLHQKLDVKKEIKRRSASENNTASSSSIWSCISCSSVCNNLLNCYVKRAGQVCKHNDTHAAVCRARLCEEVMTLFQAGLTCCHHLNMVLASVVKLLFLL